MWRKMEINRSPSPVFETDADNNYFLTVLPIHKLSQKLSQAGTKPGLSFDQAAGQVPRKYPTSHPTSHPTSQKIIKGSTRGNDKERNSRSSRPERQILFERVIYYTGIKVRVNRDDSP